MNSLNAELAIVRRMVKDLWEVKSELGNRRTARILFTIYETCIVLLHGFIKKSKKTPPSDLRLAKERMKSFLKGKQ